ncbi:MAG: Nif3-like dinuclear metal center hexameric protein [Caldimonas sp.]|uniref:Nif3-like dinuclear metal center hexameric protein n=1 Tax=Caldimonas sp. TaxID=2838790 RepID=UPI00391B5897
MIHRDEFGAQVHALLEADRFRDYGPNGLQVEGRPEIRKLVSGVTASLALIEAAAREGADAILVHHGLFWRGQDGRVTGWMKRRLQVLLGHEINLYAYHLPLDAHPQWGNNAQLGLKLKLSVQGRFGEQDLGFLGVPAQPLTVAALSALLQYRLGRAPVVVEGDGRPIRRVAWCTGGAQGYFEAAIAAGADAFLTGEISEPQAHYARETGVAYFACGHHATERFGAAALGSHLAERFGLEHQFIDIDNPA